MPLLTAQIVKSSHHWAGIYFTFLEKRPIPNSKDFQTNFRPSLKKSEK